MVYSIEGKQDQNRQSAEHGPEDHSWCNKKKNSPVWHMEKLENIQPLETRRNFKIQCQAEKAKKKKKKLLSHSLHQKLNQPIKSRLQRKSVKHKVKELEKKRDTVSQLTHKEQLPPLVWLPIQRFEVSTKISGIHSKADHPPHILKAIRNFRPKIPKNVHGSISLLMDQLKGQLKMEQVE